MKLKTQFVLAFTLFALIPAVTVGTVTKLVVGDQGIKDAQDSATQELELAQGGTESILDMIQKINIQASGEITFRMFLSGATEVKQEEVNGRLKELTETYRLLDNAILTDENAKVVGSDDESMMGVNCSEIWPETIAEVMKTGELTTSEGTRNVISGSVMQVMVMPVKDGDKVVGYFLSAINIQEIYEKVIAKAKLFDSGYIYVVEADGTMLMHPNAELLLDETAFNQLPIADEVKEQTHGNGMYTFEGKQRYYTFDTGSNGWSYVAVMPKEEVESLVDFIVRLLAIAIGAVCVISPLVALIIAGGIIKPIKKVSAGIASLADGDFTDIVKINKRDEIGQMALQLNQTTNSLSDAVSGVTSTANLMGDQAHGLADMSRNMSLIINDMNSSIDTITEGSSAQASDIQETLEMLISLEHEIDEIENNLKAVGQSAVNAQGKAVDGQSTVNTLAVAISEVRKTFEQFNKKINDLGNTVSEISNITDAINDIASQTNLLALNAAIEAARAGEMGKGFAVVAEEVRTLAEQSQKSAEEIGQLIHNVREETTGVVKDSEQVDVLLEQQGKIVTEVLSAFDQTLESIEVAGPVIKDTFASLEVAAQAGHSVRTKAESIASAAEEVVASTEIISATSQELLATSEEVSNSAAQTNQAAEGLNQTMEKFKC